MTVNKTTMLLLLGSFCLPVIAQTPLAKAFADVKSGDHKVSESARDNLPQIVEREMPTIESDTRLLCAALHDNNAYIRLQAAGVLTSIVLLGPGHNVVVVSCFPELVAAATDPYDKTRNDALFALAMNPAGPPKEAHETFIKAMGSNNFRTAELAAVGLLKEDSGENKANQRIVEEALNAAPDDKHRLNMLYAINDSPAKSELLFEASRRFLSASDADVQRAAIDAVAATGNKPQVVAIMGDLATSSSADPQTKQHAQKVLTRLQASQ